MQEFNRTSVNNDSSMFYGRMDVELTSPRRERRSQNLRAKILERHSAVNASRNSDSRQSEETSRKSEILLKTFPSASRTESGNFHWGLNFLSGTKGLWSPGFNELADFRYPISASQTGNVTNYARSNAIIIN